MIAGGHLSKEFFELVKSIGESRSKQEEDKIIVTEIAVLKVHFTKPSITAKKMREYMVRAIYAEMLGHDASFAYIHGVKLAHDKNFLAKRIGYLACNLFLHKDDELLLLLINTLQKDLLSSNYLEVCAALTSVSRLMSAEMVPAIAPLLFKLLAHQQDVVRKKAVMCVHKLLSVDPDHVLSQREAIKKSFCDPDPSVMGASLHVLSALAKGQPSSCRDLIPLFTNVLKQIIDHKLPRDFDYHRLPAPWLQIKLVTLMGILGSGDPKTSEAMYDIVQECMRKADSGVNVGHAVIYECVRCITKIYPDHALLELAANNISRFISNDNHNLKYVGVTGLAQIVQVDPKYAVEHQVAVVDCLEDADETLKRKTLDLLFRMTNSQNVTFVVEKMTEHLRTTVDAHLRRELVQRVSSLAERFAPNNAWYVTTLTSVFELGGDLVPIETTFNVMRLIAEGTGEDEETDQEFRTFAVNSYLRLFEKPVLSDVLVQVIAWVLGEYARIATVDGYDIEDILDLVCECMDRPFEDPSTRNYLVTALMKIEAINGVRSSSVGAVVEAYKASRYTDLQQRCYEFAQLQETPSLMRRVLPYDASCEDIYVNRDLSFLDGFVQKSLEAGAMPYMSPDQRENVGKNQKTAHDNLGAKPGLNYTPYSKPEPAPAPALPGTANGPSSVVGPPVYEEVRHGPPVPALGAAPWGPTGYHLARRESPRLPVALPPPVQPPVVVPPAPPAETTRCAAGSAAAAAAGEEDPEMTKKQRIAAALFGGIAPHKAASKSVVARSDQWSRWGP